MEIENIMFKAKCLDNGEWVEGDLLQNSDGTVWIGDNTGPWTGDGYSHCDNFQVCKVDPSTACLFTGLKDQNGKEVWEHDILESPCLKGEVIFVHGCFRVIKDNGSSYPFSTLIIIDGKIDYCRVVGNKFDRKEGEK